MPTLGGSLEIPGGGGGRVAQVGSEKQNINPLILNTKEEILLSIGVLILFSYYIVDDASGRSFKIYLSANKNWMATAL